MSVVCLSVRLRNLEFYIVKVFLYCTDGDSDKENVDPNPIIISDDESSSISAAAARGQNYETGRLWWMSAGLCGDGTAAQSGILHCEGFFVLYRWG